MHDYDFDPIDYHVLLLLMYMTFDIASTSRYAAAMHAFKDEDKLISGKMMAKNDMDSSILTSLTPWARMNKKGMC